MADSLADAELDLKSYMFVKHMKSGDIEEAFVQEEEEQKDDDEADDGPRNNSMTLIGRDKEGKFKHHENYL
jgi:hypothetical protein